MQPNALAFIALCNEFCSTLEGVATGSNATTRAEFVASMINYIPRLYIAATDLRPDYHHHHHHHHHDDESECSECSECSGISDFSDFPDDDFGIDNILEEEYYDSVRRAVEGLLGEEDVYLEVFEEDMRYSETPISASVSEGLADMFQSLYNFIETVREAPEERVASALEAAKEDFEHYWSRIACNLLRALNNIRYFSPSAD